MIKKEYQKFAEVGKKSSVGEILTGNLVQFLLKRF